MATVHSFLSLLGKLTAAASVIPLGLLSLRPPQRWLLSFRLDARRHRRRRIKVARPCLLALAPWKERSFFLQGMPIGVVVSLPGDRHDRCFPFGMGAVLQNRTAQGLWPA